jgi:phosphatidate phosphatase LPIN
MLRCLAEVRSLFPADGNPFIAAFGNRHTDEKAYKALGIAESRIFTINTKGATSCGCHACSCASRF